MFISSSTIYFGNNSPKKSFSPISLNDIKPGVVLEHYCDGMKQSRRVDSNPQRIEYGGSTDTLLSHANIKPDFSKTPYSVKGIPGKGRSYPTMVLFLVDRNNQTTNVKLSPTRDGKRKKV